MLALAIIAAGATSVLATDFPAASAGQRPATVPNHVVLPPVTWRIGKPSPSLAAQSITGKAVSPADFLGKPLVIEFGSATDPIFRQTAHSCDWLGASLKGRIQVLIIYGAESHPSESPAELAVNRKAGFNLPAQINETARAADAQLLAKGLHLTHTVLAVDNWDNTTSRTYGSLPDMAFVVDAQGALRVAYPVADEARIAGAVRDILAGRKVSNRYAGEPFNNAPIPLAAAAGKADGRGLAALAGSLDSLHLSRGKLRRLLPALEKFERLARAFIMARRTFKQASTRHTSAMRDALEDKLSSLRHAATNLMAALRKNLSSTDYQHFMASVGHGLLGRLLRASGFN